ncbi:cellulase family glycosylhydrolase [Patescibacteria group bacterium]|nr:cellulase family glycosylhydrolase [Patescibacteria group bacterium]MBU4367403.1 cellulase family glycosylhydrolase [Patescibacteria group bacterium]MBU4461723.1 cellulase family glycosylhydrolase [Patescibacteria group bacterium]MCG2700107.1 cellulase family glycosylhydrolase [Candidatus Parcubacteria bacterium]
MKKTLKIILLALVLSFLFLVLYFFIGRAPQAENILWGVNFSQMQTERLGLDWKDTYLALIEDLGAKYIKLIINWDWVEGKRNDYFFDDVDWQVKKAKENGVKLMMVIGMKTGRWPECHMPAWVEGLSKEERENEVLEYIQEMVLKYRDSNAVISWQVENEPFFPFGECPKTDINFLKKEVELVKSLDLQKRPIIISDTGEFSLWLKAAKIGDIAGTTMYKKVWSKELNVYFSVPFPPLFYWSKAQLVKTLLGKEVQCVELQAEPWGPILLYDLPIEEQQKSMNLEKFKHNIEFAKKTGFDTFYLWGAEWWYWLKEKHNQPEIWNEARKLFQP